MKDLNEYVEEEINDKMKIFVNMIIDRVLEDRKNGILKRAEKPFSIKEEYET